MDVRIILDLTLLRRMPTVRVAAGKTGNLQPLLPFNLQGRSNRRIARRFGSMRRRESGFAGLGVLALQPAVFFPEL